MGYTYHNGYPAKSISYGSKRKASAIKYICFHFTANTTDKAANNARFYATSNTRTAGAHYFVDGTDVYQSIDDLLVAWSVGGSKTTDYKETGGASMYGKVTNANSISIEMCSTSGAISEETQANAVELAKKLMTKYNIPSANCYRHFDVTGKHCPGWSGWYGSDSSKWKAFKAKLSNSATKYAGTFPTLPERGFFKKGDTGSQVVLVQKLLNWVGGYGLAEDGSYGPATVAAVKKFQQSQLLKEDGCFGNGCLSKARTIAK